jgi:DNA-binding transcriptional ArsR family regulator
MAIKNPTREDISLAHTLLFNGRKIVPSLNKKPKSIGELSLDTGMSRSETCYRMSRLENIGIVQLDYEIIKEPTPPSSGTIKWLYKINQQKLDEARQAVEKVISFYRGLLQNYSKATV